MLLSKYLRHLKVRIFAKGLFRSKERHSFSLSRNRNSITKRSVAVVGVRFVCHSKRWNVGTYRRSTEYTLEKTSNNQIDFREMTKQISKRMEKFRIFSLIICHGYVKMYNLRHKYRHKHQCLFICISISNGASEQSETMFIRSH